jgi:hypothetical protein
MFDLNEVSNEIEQMRKKYVCNEENIENRETFSYNFKKIEVVSLTTATFNNENIVRPNEMTVIKEESHAVESEVGTTVFDKTRQNFIKLREELDELDQYNLKYIKNIQVK